MFPDATLGKTKLIKPISLNKCTLQSIEFLREVNTHSFR